MNVRTKLVGGFAVVLACAAVVGLWAVASMSTMNAKSGQVANVDYPAVGAVDDMTNAVNTLVRHQREGVGAPTADEKNGAFDEVKADEEEFLGALKTYGTLATAADDRQRVAWIQAEFAKYRTIPQYRELNRGMTLGEFKVPIRLHRDVTVDATVNVVREEE